MSIDKFFLFILTVEAAGVAPNPSTYMERGSLQVTSSFYPLHSSGKGKSQTEMRSLSCFGCPLISIIFSQ